MTSQELADKILEVCEEATGRVLGIGDEQYATKLEFRPLGGDGGGIITTQRTEVESLDEHLDGLVEELLDTINHAAMTVLKIRGLRRA